MSYAEGLDALFAVLVTQLNDVADADLDTELYWVFINLCRGTIVLACKEQAEFRHRKYSGQIKNTLQVMHKLSPEVAMRNEFHLNDVDAADFDGWEEQSRYVASALDCLQMRDNGNTQPLDFDHILTNFKNAKALMRAVDVVDGWTSRLEYQHRKQTGLFALDAPLDQSSR